MTASELLGEVQAKGITLLVDSDNLRCQGQESVLTPQLIAELREHKAEIICLMRCGKCQSPLVGAINKWWQIIDGDQTSYLCSALCAHQAYPWKLE